MNIRSYSCVLLLLCSTHSASGEEKWLSRNQLETMFSGNTIETIRPKAGIGIKNHSYNLWTREGEMYYDGGNKPLFVADWYINDKNQVCTQSRSLTCMNVSYDGQYFKGWTNETGKYEVGFIMTPYKGDPFRIQERFKNEQIAERQISKQDMMNMLLIGAILSQGVGGNTDSGGNNSWKSNGWSPDRRPAGVP